MRDSTEDSTSESEEGEGSETGSESASAEGRTEVMHGQRSGGRVFGIRDGAVAARREDEVCNLLLELREADCAYQLEQPQRDIGKSQETDMVEPSNSKEVAGPTSDIDAMNTESETESESADESADDDSEASEEEEVEEETEQPLDMKEAIEQSIARHDEEGDVEMEEGDTVESDDEESEDEEEP